MLAVVLTGLVRSRRLPQLGVISLLLVVAGCAAYAPLRSLPFFEPRFVEFTIPFAVVLIVGGDGRLSSFANSSRAVRSRHETPPR